ncbi:uncharacterized protein GGS22DRAFT_199626 [Annulohypoxylon maeteangense]|uniref:uncharacterized protein n=1 Tax=Annulohypoxylon maeteangense TaxID=1927788 RepID=UPI0020079FA6|nr:uncharacterized protein GGS22DRAFT_199626 [Annulohypoxylon maeteangense]KAI0886350.1 hypothetical protein GGS22DRAFT_199626 [Annulohypoxylon maeteangense]
MDYLLSRLDPSMTPVAPPPPGVVSNFVDPPSVAWGPRLAVYLTFPLLILVACLRFASLIDRMEDVDDSNGRHSWDTPLTTYDASYFKKNFASIIVYNVTATLAKTSILALYLRIFRPFQAAVVMIWVGAVVTILLYTATSIVAMVSDIPRPGDGGWGSEKTNLRSAKPSGQLLAAAGVGGTVTDFYVFLLPIYFVSKISMRVNRKIGVGCLFLAGLIPCACSTVGTVFRFQFLSATTGIDGTWVGTQMQALAYGQPVSSYKFAVVANKLGYRITEINTGIFCGCMPVAFCLFKSTYQWIESGLVSFKDLFNSLRSRSSMKAESSSNKSDAAPNLSEKIPRGIVTGLRSFMQNGLRSKAEKTGADGTIPSYVDLHSIDYETFGRV